VVGEYFLTTMREAAVSVSADRGGAPVVDVHAGELATHRSMGGAVVLLGAVSIRLGRGCGCQREDGRGGRAESFEHGKRSDMFMISSSAGVFSLNRSSRTLQIGMQGPFAGVVQHLLVSGYTGVREAASLPGSCALGLKQSQQGQTVRMALAGHQLARALALALGTPAAHEAAVVQEEAQQVQV